jgi:hypothetical protein
MTEYEQERDYDPRLAEAIERPGMDSFLRLMMTLAGTQKLDPADAQKLFYQLIGHLSSQAAARQARPWQYLSLVLLAAEFITIAILYNLLFLLALGLI